MSPFMYRITEGLRSDFIAKLQVTFAMEKKNLELIFRPFSVFGHGL